MNTLIVKCNRNAVSAIFNTNTYRHMHTLHRAHPLTPTPAHYRIPAARSDTKTYTTVYFCKNARALVNAHLGAAGWRTGKEYLFRHAHALQTLTNTISTVAGVRSHSHTVTTAPSNHFSMRTFRILLARQESQTDAL